MRGRAGRPVCREAQSPHHVSAEWFRGGWLWTTWGFVLSGTRSPGGEPVAQSRTSQSLLFKRLQARSCSASSSVLTSGAPGSLHSQAPRLSGPLGLGPEEVPRVAGVRTSSGAWLGQEQGLWRVWSPSRDQGCGDGNLPAGSSALQPPRGQAREGGWAPPRHLEESAPHPAALRPWSHAGALNPQPPRSAAARSLALGP